MTKTLEFTHGVQRFVWPNGDVTEVPTIRESDRGGWVYKPPEAYPSRKNDHFGRSQAGRDKAREWLYSWLDGQFAAHNWQKPNVIAEPPREPFRVEGTPSLQLWTELGRFRSYFRATSYDVGPLKVQVPWLASVLANKKFDTYIAPLDIPVDEADFPTFIGDPLGFTLGKMDSWLARVVREVAPKDPFPFPVDHRYMATYRAVGEDWGDTDWKDYEASWQSGYYTRHRLPQLQKYAADSFFREINQLTEFFKHWNVEISVNSTLQILTVTMPDGHKFSIGGEQRNHTNVHNCPALELKEVAEEKRQQEIHRLLKDM